MKPLFAPWRMEFIQENRETPADHCIFCEILEDTCEDQKRLVLERKKYAYILMNRYPYGYAHLLVLPNRHVKHFEELTKDESYEMDQLTKKAIFILKKTFHPQGFNLGTNLGKASGAGIENHLHQHILPRWEADTNFMPLLAETRVIAEHLDKTYQKIREAWT